MEEVLIMLIMLATLFGLFYLYFSTRHKERMALIEKGENVDLFITSKPKSSVPLYAVILINFGILGVGIGLGILFGQLLYMGGMDDDVSYPSSIFICIGLALLTGFYITKNLDKRYRNQDY